MLKDSSMETTKPRIRPGRPKGPKRKKKDLVADFFREATQPRPLKLDSENEPIMADVTHTTPAIKREAIALIDAALNSNPLSKPDTTAVTPKAIYEAFRNFEAAVGGRRKLMQILEHCPTNSVGYNMMLRLTQDPDFLKVSVRKKSGEEVVRYALSVLCSRHKIPLQTLALAFKDARIAQITIEALCAVGDKASTVIEQMAEDAQNRFVPCHNCYGTGRVQRMGDNGELSVNEDGSPITQVCWTCHGKKVLWKDHDWQNRQKLLEVVGVSQKAPLVQTNIDNRSVSIGAPGDGTFEKAMKALDNIARGKTLDKTAEIIDVQPESNSEASESN